MFASLFSAGLILPRSGAPFAQGDAEIRLTDAAALTPEHGEDLRVDLIVAEDAIVAQGQPLMRLRAASGIALVAPMAGRVARIDLQPGRRLSQLVLFHDAAGDRHQFQTADAERDPAALSALLGACGLWRAFRSRPFGRAPQAGERPAAIFVMAVDSRPDAPAPQLALSGRDEDFARGLAALAGLASGPLLLCEPRDGAHGGPVPAGITRLRCPTRHPQGLAGLLIHRRFPARIGARVWDIAAEDVADIGTLLATGYLPPTRLVAMAGDALREARLLRCQPGADLRGLSQSLVRPGPHDLLSGSILDGRPAHWLAPRDRQITVMKRAQDSNSRRHWFRAALEDAARHAPIIPTAALEQAMGGADLPAAALLRALAAGDTESFIRLGGLSLVEEDLALADYAIGARPRLAHQLRAMLTRIAQEEDAA